MFCFPGVGVVHSFCECCPQRRRNGRKVAEGYDLFCDRTYIQTFSLFLPWGSSNVRLDLLDTLQKLGTSMRQKVAEEVFLGNPLERV